MFQLYQEYVESNKEYPYLVVSRDNNIASTPAGASYDVVTSDVWKFIDQRIMEQLGIYGFNRDIQKTSK